MTDARYARQTVIEHWDQERLHRSHVVVVGAGTLGGFISLGLAALGVGALTLIDDGVIAPGKALYPFPSLTGAPAGARRATAIGEALRAINPDVTTRSIPLRLRYDAMALSIPACDVLIDASGDPVSQRICARYARQKDTRVIVADAGASGGVCAFDMTDDDSVIAEGEPDAGVCEVIAGAVIEEVRKRLMPLPGDGAGIEGPLSYDINEPLRFRSRGQRQSTPQRTTSLGHVLVIGAGALGTYVALALALGDTVSQLTIVDPDTVEETNLNRQVLYHDAVGQPKAAALARKLALLQPGSNVTPIIGVVAECHVEAADMCFLCVDNYEARAQVNHWAVRAGRPFVNGGTSPFGGHVEVYAPGRTACLNCRLDVERLAREQAGQRARCSDVIEAGIVQTNMLVAGLMVCEGRVASSNSLPAVIEYDARMPARFGLRSARPACDCGQHSTDHHMETAYEPG